MQTIENVINMGKSAIMLVPEISLTPQMVSRFMSRFGGRVAIFFTAVCPPVKDMTNGRKFVTVRLIL